MSKYNIDDIVILGNLSKILNIKGSKGVEIKKEEQNDRCTFLGIKDMETKKVLLSIDHMDNDKVIGKYVAWFTEVEMNYSIRRLFRDTLLLEVTNNDLKNIEIKLLQGSRGYADSVYSIINEGVKAIEQSSLGDLQILTNEEAENGMQLVKQIKPAKK